MTLAGRRALRRLRNRFDPIVAIGLSLLGIAALMWAIPRASAADWLLLRQLPGQQWEKRGPVLDEYEACKTAAASDRLSGPLGTKARCEKVTKETSR